MKYAAKLRFSKILYRILIQSLLFYAFLTYCIWGDVKGQMFAIVFICLITFLFFVGLALVLTTTIKANLTDEYVEQVNLLSGERVFFRWGNLSLLRSGLMPFYILKSMDDNKIVVLPSLAVEMDPIKYKLMLLNTQQKRDLFRSILK